MSIMLIEWCSNNDFAEVKKTLKYEQNLNLLYDDGDCLHFAAKYKNAAMMEALLKYFYEVQLPQIENKYLRKDTENKLKEILEEVESSWVITDEVELIINKYLDSKGSTADSSDKNLNSPKKHDELAKTAYNSGDISKMYSSDPMDNLDPLKHFSNTSTQNIPEKDVACSGDFSDTTDPIG